MELKLRVLIYLNLKNIKWGYTLWYVFVFEATQRLFPKNGRNHFDKCGIYNQANFKQQSLNTRKLSCFMYLVNKAPFPIKFVALLKFQVFCIIHPNKYRWGWLLQSIKYQLGADSTTVHDGPSAVASGILVALLFIASPCKTLSSLPLLRIFWR